MDGQHTIGIAGVGKMGEALVRGLLVGHVFPPARIFVSDAIPPRAKEVSAKHGVGFSETVEDLAGRADTLVLAAKPKDMAALVEAIGPRLKKDALVISLAAGVRTSFIEKTSPAAVGSSASCRTWPAPSGRGQARSPWGRPRRNTTRSPSRRSSARSVG